MENFAKETQKPACVQIGPSRAEKRSEQPRSCDPETPAFESRGHVRGGHVLEARPVVVFKSLGPLPAKSALALDAAAEEGFTAYLP